MAWAELTDCRCFFELLGTGEPLLLIPGLGSTSAMWEPVVPDLAQFFTVITFDNRGVGRSVSKRLPASMADLSSDIVELLDYLQLDRAHVLGVSLGGIIAQRLAVDHPSRIDRLVLISCADVFSPYLTQMASLLAHTLRRFPREMFVRTMALLGTAPEFIDNHGDIVEQRVRNNCARKISPRAIGQQLRCLAGCEIDPKLYRITAPTLVIAGEHDPIIPSCYSRQMAERIPKSRFRLIRRAGHDPLIDHPQWVLPELVEFLQEDKENDKDKQESGTSQLCAPRFGEF